MPEYRIPVYWTMSAVVAVVADNLAAAVEKLETAGELPSDAEYDEGTFVVSTCEAWEIDESGLERAVTPVELRRGREMMSGDKG